MFECKKFLCCVASSMFALIPVVLSHAYCGDAPSAAKCAEEMNLEKYFRAKNSRLHFFEKFERKRNRRSEKQHF